MNEKAQEYLKSILAKDPSNLTQDEMVFLKARRDYLTTEQKRIFASVLGEEAIVEAPSQPQVEVVEPEIVVTPQEEVQPQVEAPSEPQVEVANDIADDGSADPDYKPQN